MSNNNNNQSQTQESNAESLLNSQKENSTTVYVIYSVFLGILFMIISIFEMINYLAFGLSLDDFAIEFFTETDDYITWSENSVMSLSFMVISLIFFWAAVILLRESSDRGKAYLMTGTTLAVFLLIIFLLVVLAENITVLVETLDAEESIFSAEWVFNAYTPIYLGILSLPGFILLNPKKGKLEK
ncbi:MAG: hypothetical protein KAR35_09505 [Candidatus Heimdallarchaeota archaeon]|nr:hypothetical protein [Candidatus Heimdallarchaeota archaeon]MCK5049592.1 hypothetical protein [Candidatus Heimdallarchaeota archaeon]